MRFWHNQLEAVDRATEKHRAAPPRRTANRQLQNALSRLRRENEDLRRHLAIYEDHIRRLATENAHLRDEPRRGRARCSAASARRRSRPLVVTV
jgi:predicted RNase H-like nuclease (RuvC/YqgF family)